MTTARQLFHEGRVRDAAQALAAHLREHPTDSVERCFLFELLCFAGEFDRAEKHLAILGQGGKQSELAVLLYTTAIQAERARQGVFLNGEGQLRSSSPPSAAVHGKLNGKPFASISDADPEIGARLEVFAGGSYLWFPFAHLAAVAIEPPRRLRDTLWATARVRAASGSQQQELGEVLLPMVYPFSWKCEDESVWLGRSTAWIEDDDGKEYPLGQKLLMVDGVEVPFLEIRSLEFDSIGEAEHS